MLLIEAASCSIWELFFSYKFHSWILTVAVSASSLLLFWLQVSRRLYVHFFRIFRPILMIIDVWLDVH